MKTPITKDSLIAYGMTLSNNPMYPMGKVLGKNEYGELALVISRAYNSDQFALILPGGGTLYVNPSCIEDLKKFEEMIWQYEPNY